jgi:hypothetical protein
MENGPKVAMLFETGCDCGPRTTLPPHVPPVYILIVIEPPALLPEEPSKVAVSVIESVAVSELVESCVESVGVALLTFMGCSHMLFAGLSSESPL